MVVIKPMPLPVLLGELNFKSLGLIVWPHEVELWFHSWYRGRVETLMLNIISYLGSYLLTVRVAT